MRGPVRKPGNGIVGVNQSKVPRTNIFYLVWVIDKWTADRTTGIKYFGQHYVRP